MDFGSKERQEKDTKNGYSSRATNLLLTLNLILMKKTQYKYTDSQTISKFMR